MVPSKFFHGSGARDYNLTRQFMKGLNPMLLIIKKMMQSVDFGMWQTMQDVYDLAGGSKDFDGCHLALAIIWQAYTLPHFDSKDFAYCVTTCGGRFTGGRMVFSQFGLVFE
jgi:hypothetical protein